MKKLDLLKAGAEILVSTGVGSIVGNAIKMTTNPEANKFTRISIAIGGFVLSSMISDLATKHVNGIIDDVAEKVAEILRPEEEKDVVTEIEDDGPNKVGLSGDAAKNPGSDYVIDKDESNGKLLPSEGKDTKQNIKEGASE